MKIERMKAEYAGITKPYGAGVKIGNMIYLSGMAGIDPATNQVVIDPIYNNRVEECVNAQIECIFKKVEATLKKFGATLNDIVYLESLLVGAEIWPFVAQAIKREMPDGLYEQTAHTAFGVTSLVPPGAFVEVAVTAVAPE